MNNLNLLKKLGFTEYEARAYFSLARLGPSVVKDIVADSKLPRNKAYEALQRLEEKNKVVSIPLSPKKYKITNPDILKEEFNDMSSSVNKLIKLIEQPKSNNFKDFFWILKGRKSIVEKLASENKICSKEIFSCSELNHMPYKNIRIIKEKVADGVVVRFITIWDEKNIKFYKAWSKAGVNIRIYDEAKLGSFPRLTVIDNKKARLTVGLPEVSKEDEYVTFWTESVVFANMLRNQFLMMWDNSKYLTDFTD